MAKHEREDAATVRAEEFRSVVREAANNSGFNSRELAEILWGLIVELDCPCDDLIKR